MRQGLLLAAVLLLVHCSTPLKTKGLSFASGVRIDLPPLGAFDTAIGATHQLEVQNRGNTYRFPAQVEIEKDRLVIVGLTPVGSRAFSLVYDGSGITYEVIPFFNLPLKPDKFLLAYMLVVWPEKVLSQSLEAQGLQLKTQAGRTAIHAQAGPVVRYFRDSDSPTKKEITLQHLEEGYWLKVKTLQWEEYPFE